MVNLTNQPLDKDTFRFVVPADLEKAADGSYKIRGLASTERVDQQGEVIIQKGVDLTPIDKKKGVLNWDHARGPENTIGILDGYERTSKGLVIEGRLFKNHTKAKAVREIMESLGDSDRGRMGLSVEGKIIERDKNNPSVILKCQISAVALTMNPVNNDTFADIIKSMNSAQEVEFNAEEQLASQPSEEAMFTATQVLQIVQKALGIGAGAMGAPDAKTGGDALSPSDMQPEKKKKIEKGEEDEDGSVFSSKPIKKAKMKKMNKSLYKSNLITVLDKLQILYPNHSRSDIWEAVKDRLDSKYDINKGGEGSGKRGHVTVRQKDYHWGTMRHVETDHQTIPVHPEHWEKMKNVHEGHKEKDSFKDETGKEWKVSKHPEGGVHLQHDSVAGKFSHHVGKEHMKELESKKDAAGQKVESELDKGLRIHNTSGKEREHKLYEDARQREDYERNKDKSRSELVQLAEESGASKHDKQKIKAQADAAIQAGEDRDHVRPNIKS